MNNSLRFHRFLLFLLLAVFLFDKIVVLVNFNWRYTDHDQCTLWNAAYEAAQLKFHEPCFYGQDYNSNLEAYVAVPFLWCGIHCSKALPMATFILVALIFILSALTFFRQRAYMACYLMLLAPMLLPDSFQLVTSLPRGFVTGVFLVALGYFLYSKFEKQKFFFWFLFATLGFWMNPNSVMMSAPLTLLILGKEPWTENWKRMVAGALAGSVYKMVVIIFYALHPTYVYHVKATYSYDWNLLKEGLLHMDKFFFYRSWFFWILLFFCTVVFLKKKMKLEAWICAFFAMMIVFTLGFKRVHEELPTVFFHGGRMYIGAIWTFIFLGALAWNEVVKSWPPNRLKWMGGIFLGVAICAMIFRNNRIEQYIDYTVNYYDKGVIVSSVSELEERNEMIISTCNSYDVDLVVYDKQCVECFMDCYTLPIYSNGKVETLNLLHDRRNWRFLEEQKLPSRKFLLYLPDVKVKNMDDYIIGNGNFPYIDFQIVQIDTNVIDFFAPRMTGERVVY